MVPKLVSVIIPCFNDAGTLERAIKSVVAQTYPSIEIIVVNDCSPQTDAIARCVSRFPTITYVRNEFNVGLAASRNRGLSLASGEIVAFLDADDAYEPEKIAAQMSVFEKDCAFTCGLRRTDIDGRDLSNVASNELPSRRITRPDGLLLRNTLNGPGLLINRSYWPLADTIQLFVHAKIMICG